MIAPLPDRRHVVAGLSALIALVAAPFQRADALTGSAATDAIAGPDISYLPELVTKRGHDRVVDAWWACRAPDMGKDRLRASSR